MTPYEPQFASTGSATVGGRGSAVPGRPIGVTTKARAYFASDSRRTIQTALGLIWLLDGAL